LFLVIKNEQDNYLNRQIKKDEGMTKTITINVSSDIADFYERVDKHERKHTEMYINQWLTEIIEKKSADNQLFDIMKKCSAQAQKNGYKEEMLEDIVNDIMTDD
jgi:hypothetical protein